MDSIAPLPLRLYCPSGFPFSLSGQRCATIIYRFRLLCKLAGSIRSGLANEVMLSKLSSALHIHKSGEPHYDEAHCTCSLALSTSTTASTASPGRATAVAIRGIVGSVSHLGYAIRLSEFNSRIRPESSDLGLDLAWGDAQDMHPGLGNFSNYCKGLQRSFQVPVDLNDSLLFIVAESTAARGRRKAYKSR